MTVLYNKINQICKLNILVTAVNIAKSPQFSWHIAPIDQSLSYINKEWNSFSQMFWQFMSIVRMAQFLHNYVILAKWMKK